MVKLSGCFSAGLVGTALRRRRACELAERGAASRSRVHDARASSPRTRRRSRPTAAAAAAISISFAAAPATRMPYSPVPRTAVEPPVTWKPNHSAIL